MEIRSKSAKLIVQFFLILHSVMCLFPLVWLFTSSFKSNPEFFYNPGFIPQNFSPENYINAWVDGEFGSYFLNSVFYSIVSVFSVLVIASLAAYAFAKFRFKGAMVIFSIMVATIMIPLPGSFIQIYSILKSLALLNTRTGYILVMIAANLPTAIFIMKGFFEQIPNEIIEAAKIDGCSPLNIWARISLPMATPVLATVGILNTLSVWNEYIIAAITFSSQKLMPIQQGLMTFQGQYQTRYDLMIAATAITIIPLILAYILLHKQVIQGASQGAVKG